MHNKKSLYNKLGTSKKKLLRNNTRWKTYHRAKKILFLKKFSKDSNFSFIKISSLKNNFFFNLSMNGNYIGSKCFNSSNLGMSLTKKKQGFKTRLLLRSIEQCLSKKIMFRKMYVKLRLRKKLKKQLIMRLTKMVGDSKKAFIEIKSNKCFNGCRPLKFKRHSKKGLRILKE